MTFGSKQIARNVTLADAEAPIQDIGELDITALLAQALASQNYRVAVRLYYLRALHVLAKTGKIVWKKDKTNRDLPGRAACEILVL